MRNEEARLQTMCVRWFDLQYPTKRLQLFSIPNEGKRNEVNGARMKVMGRRKGAPDMVLLASAGRVVFFEFKSEKGKLSPEQKAFHETIRGWGGVVYIVKSFDDFCEIVSSEIKV